MLGFVGGLVAAFLTVGLIDELCELVGADVVVAVLSRFCWGVFCVFVGVGLATKSWVVSGPVTTGQRTVLIWSGVIASLMVICLPFEEEFAAPDGHRSYFPLGRGPFWDPPFRSGLTPLNAGVTVTRNQSHPIIPPALS